MYDDREQGQTDIHPPFRNVDVGTLQEVTFELFTPRTRRPLRRLALRERQNPVRGKEAFRRGFLDR